MLVTRGVFDANIELCFKLDINNALRAKYEI